MLKLIHTKNNSFIVDVETKPGEIDWYYDPHYPDNVRYGTNNAIEGGYKKKILYSLNKIDDSIPLFEIVEDEVERLAENLYYSVGNNAISSKDSFIKGYNQTKATKGYSLEQMFDFAEFLLSNVIEYQRGGTYVVKTLLFDDSVTYTINELFQEYLKLNQPKEQKIEILGEVNGKIQVKLI